MSVWVRRCLTVGCLLAAWLVVRPAVAAAPVCDERAASMVAPPPTLDAPGASIDVGERPDGCDTETSRDKAYHRGQRSHRAPPAVRADMTLAPITGVVAASAHDALRRPNVANVDRAGVRFLLERPPR